MKDTIDKIEEATIGKWEYGDSPEKKECQHQFFEVEKLIGEKLENGLHIMCVMCGQHRELWSKKGLIIKK